MNRINRPDMAPSHCQKCGCLIIYTSDGGEKPLAKCEGCGYSFRFDYQAAKKELDGCCSCFLGIAVVATVLFVARAIYIMSTN